MIPLAHRPLGAVLAALLAATWPARGRGDGERVEMANVDIESLLDLSVQSVTRRLERSSEAPASVFVLTAEDIRRQGFATVGEVLGSVPGLFGYPGHFYQVGVRGMGVLGDFTTRLLLLVDGHPMVNAVGNDLGRGLPLPLSAIQRIEVIKGPAGSVYGPSAFFGVVNLVTTGGRTAAEAFAASDATAREVRSGEVQGLWRGAIGDVDGVAAASFYSTRGLDYRFGDLAGIPGAPAGGLVKGMDFGDAGNGYLSASWRALTARVACGHSYAGLSGMIVPDRGQVFESLACFAEGAWRTELAQDVALTARVSYDDFEAGARRTTPEPPASVGRLVDEGYDRWATAEARLDWRPVAGLRTDVGATFKQHTADHEQRTPAVPALSSSLTREFAELNAWTSVEARPRADTTLHGGLTWSYHALFGSQLSPKLAAVWQPTRDDTAKAIWSMGFRPPTILEALFTDKLAYVANPSLRPEKVTSLEVVYERRLLGVASASASAFWNRYRDLIDYATIPAPGLDHPPDPANAGDFRQVARNSTRDLDVLGGELVATLRLGPALQAHGGVSLQRVGEAARPNFPRTTANLALSSNALWRPLVLAARGAFVSARAKVPAPLSPTVRAEVPPAITVDAVATLAVPGVRGLEVQVAVLNVLDSAGPSPAPASLAPVTELPDASRSVRGIVRWRH